MSWLPRLVRTPTVATSSRTWGGRPGDGTAGWHFDAHPPQPLPASRPRPPLNTQAPEFVEAGFFTGQFPPIGEAWQNIAYRAGRETGEGATITSPCLGEATVCGRHSRRLRLYVAQNAPNGTFSTLSAHSKTASQPDLTVPSALFMATGATHLRCPCLPTGERMPWPSGIYNGTTGRSWDKPWS